MDHWSSGSGARLRAMVTLMLLSLGVMLAAIFALYFAPLGVAPLVATSLYAGLWAYERRLGVASPITRVMIVFHLVCAMVAFGADDPSWMTWIAPTVYWTLAVLILSLLAAGRPFTAMNTGDLGFLPLHRLLSAMWGGLHFAAGLAAVILAPSTAFLYVPLALMVLGALATVWVNFVSMGPAWERPARFDLEGYSFREARSRGERETFHNVIAEAYRADLQSALGMRRKIDAAEIAREHRATGREWRDDFVPFLAYAGGRPVGGIGIFFDRGRRGLPIEGEAQMDLGPWRRVGRVAEVGRLGVLRRHRLSPVLLKGLFKCVIDVAAERRIHFIFNDSFEFQARMYEKLGFKAFRSEPYLSRAEHSTGYGLWVLPMMMDLAAIVRGGSPGAIAADLVGHLAPYVMERYFKHLVIHDIARGFTGPKRGSGGNRQCNGLRVASCAARSWGPGWRQECRRWDTVSWRPDARR